MPTWQPDLAPFVNRIPRLYFLLRAAGDALHADLGITTGMRGVMTSLAATGPRAVPELARERPVSRQHIQTLAKALLAAGLVEARPNPEHRRSPLLSLTDEGRRRLKEMQDCEAALLARTAPSVSPVELAAATRLFDLLERDLAARVIEAGLG
ncbi:MAG TPA: MarR family winged helix-turn-helix transcriptional regulator [Caulobacteraceae bacterium]|jgi:DNA-binding MarR family transcriptional regulator